MKRIISLPFFLISFFVLSNQETIAQNSFGIGPTIGFGPSAFKYESSTTGTSYSGQVVPNLGIVGVFKVQSQLDLRASILISPVQDKISGNSSEAPYTHTNVYLKIPVDLMYVIKAGPGQVHVGAGPFFSTGFSGNTKGILFNNGLPEDYLKKGDWGIDFRAEYVFHFGLFATLYYSPGLENLTTVAGDPAVHTTAAGWAIGYLFGCHKKK